MPLAEQDRARWDAAAIAEGTALLAATLVAYPIGRYQAQAAIAAVHAEARRAEDTDWPQILALYERAHRAGARPGRHPQPRSSPSPWSTARRRRSPQLAAAEPALAGYHRVDAVRAHLLEQAGDRDGRPRRATAGRPSSP